MSEWPEYTHDGGSPLWRAVKSLAHIIENESDRWFLWVPVCFGAGIGLYFALWQEPAGYLIAAGLVIALSFMRRHAEPSAGLDILHCLSLRGAGLWRRQTQDGIACPARRGEITRRNGASWLD